VTAGEILVATDGSPVSREPLARAVEMARQGGLALTGFFVLDGGWPDFIGNDWQSARGARQGFLDHVRAEQEAQAGAARAQFEEAAAGVPAASFRVLAGDPVEVITDLARSETTGLLVLSRRVFQVSGRPGLRRLARVLAERADRPILLLP